MGREGAGLRVHEAAKRGLVEVAAGDAPAGKEPVVEAVGGLERPLQVGVQDGAMPRPQAVKRRSFWGQSMGEDDDLHRLGHRGQPTFCKAIPNQHPIFPQEKSSTGTLSD